MSWTCECSCGGVGGGGGGGERLIKDLKRKANSLSRDTRQANALRLEGGPPPLGNCSTFAGSAMPDAAKMYAFSGRVGRVPMIGLMRAMVYARVASSLIREPIFDWVILSSCVLFCPSTRRPSRHGLAPLISTSKVVARIRAPLPAN